MYLRDRLKTALLAVAFVVLALVVGLGVGLGMWEIGLRSFLTAFAWLLVILLLVGISSTLGDILRELREQRKDDPT